MKKWLPTSLVLTVLFILVSCSSTSPIGMTTLSDISPKQGITSGGETVTLTGDNIFDATEGYEQALEITVCGASLSNVTVTGTQRVAKSSSGQNVSVTVGTTVTGKTTAVQNPASATSDVVLTRPDGTSVILTNAFNCNDAPVVSNTNGNYTMQEIAQQNTVITTIQATDTDGSILSYEIIDGNSNDTFSLDNTTGQLRLAKRVNHDDTPNFELLVKITDSNGLSANDTLNINVLRDTRTFNWRLTSSWSSQYSLYQPIHNVLVNTLKSQLSTQSDNQINITITAPTSTTINTNVFDDVSNGTFEMGHTATSLYRHKDLAHDFFTSQPSGLNETQHDAWLKAEGQALWNELNAPSNLIAFKAGTSGDKSVGWFRQPITDPSQLDGLRWRMGGIAAAVAAGAGVYIPNNSELITLSPLYSALQNGTLDAVKWSGPYADWQNNLHQSGAVYYPAPDWGQPNAALTLYINLDKYNTLPVRLQNVIQSVSEETSVAMANKFADLNTQGLTNIKNSGVTVLEFPQSVRDYLAIHADAFQNARSENNAFYKKVYDSWKQFR